MMTIGGWDAEKYGIPGSKNEDLLWSNLARNKNYWTVHVDKITMHGEQMLKNTSNIVLDTGMTFSIVPVDDFREIAMFLFTNYGVKFQESATYQGFFMGLIDSDGYKRLPDININIKTGVANQEIQFVIPKEDYMVNSDTDDVYLFALQPLDFVPLGAEDGDGNYWIIGLLLLKNYYTVYDMDNQRVGIIKAHPSAGPLNWVYILNIGSLIILFLIVFTGCCFCGCCFLKPCKMYKEKMKQKRKEMLLKTIPDLDIDNHDDSVKRQGLINMHVKQPGANYIN